MADLDPYGGGDYTRERPRQQYRQPPAQQPPSYGGQQPTQVWEQPSTPAPYTPPANAGSWNDYYHQHSGNQAGNTGYGGYLPTATGSWNDYYQQPQQQGGWGGAYQQQQPQPYAAAPPSYQMDQNYQYGGNVQGTSYGQLGGYAGQLEGFNSDKLNDPTHNSAKYMFARVASRYAPTQQGFAQLVNDPDFQRLGFQSVGNGNIRLPNGELVDVVRGFQSGGQAWQWGAQDAGQPAQAQPAQGGQFPGYQDPYAAWNQQYAWNGQAGYPPVWQQGYSPYYDQQAYYGQQQPFDPNAYWGSFFDQYAQYQQQQPMAPAAPPVQDWSGYQGGYSQMQPAPYPQMPAFQGAPMAWGGPSYNQGVVLYGGGPAGGGAPYQDPLAQAFQYMGQGMNGPQMYF